MVELARARGVKKSGYSPHVTSEDKTNSLTVLENRHIPYNRNSVLGQNIILSMQLSHFCSDLRVRRDE